MAGISLATAQTQLDAYLAAETALLTNSQEYTIGIRRYKRADLEAVQAGITLWNRRVQELSARQRRGRSITPSPLF